MSSVDSPAAPSSVVNALHATATRPLRVVIADDHAMILDGLRTLLSLQMDFSVVGVASDGREAVRLVRELRPDVLLLDYQMPRMSGLDVVRELRNVAVRIIVLTAAIDRDQTLALFREGARGIVGKEASTEALIKCIRAVHAGEVWIKRGTVADLLDAIQTRESAARGALPNFHLTPREKRVLELVIEGETNKGIAQRLAVCQDTVKHHLTSIFTKTGASSRLELALFALHHSIVPQK